MARHKHPNYNKMIRLSKMRADERIENMVNAEGSCSVMEQEAIRKQELQRGKDKLAKGEVVI